MKRIDVLIVPVFDHLRGVANLAHKDKSVLAETVECTSNCACLRRFLDSLIEVESEIIVVSISLVFLSCFTAASCLEWDSFLVICDHI